MGGHFRRGTATCTCTCIINIILCVCMCMYYVPDKMVLNKGFAFQILTDDLCSTSMYSHPIISFLFST